MGKEKLDKEMVNAIKKSFKDFNTVQECLDAGFTWDKCVKMGMVEGKLKGHIVKACPRPMKTVIVDAVLSGEPINFTDEPAPEDKKKEKEE